MSNSSPCDLEAGMRSLSISSPAKPQEITAFDQEAVLDSVFVDGDPVEARQGDVQQQERLDSTDALLLDATSKMDDTAFLDEVIARNCQSSVSADEDYIDEVIARSIKRSMENLLDGDYGDLNGTRYMDEVISRCVQPKKDTATATATSATCPRQQVCDNVVKRYLDAVKDSPPLLMTKKVNTPQTSANRPPVGKLKSPFLAPAQPFFTAGLNGNRDKKVSVVNVLQNQTEDRGQLKDWKTLVHQKKEHKKVSANLEEQLKESKAAFLKQELELDDMGRKLAGALAAKESLERKLEDMNTWHETNKENLGVKEEEVRLRKSDIVRLDLEVTAKEKMLEEASNAAIEAEKKLFGLELSVKSLEGKVVSLETENDRLRQGLSQKSAESESRCLEKEELLRKLVVEEKRGRGLEECLTKMGAELKNATQELEEAQTKNAELQLSFELLKVETCQAEETKENEEKKKADKENFGNIRAKFDVDIKLNQPEEQVNEMCPVCEVMKAKREELEETLKKSHEVSENAKEEMMRLQRMEATFKEEIEVAYDLRTSLQTQIKSLEDRVTDEEVKKRGAEAMASMLDEKLEVAQEKLRAVKVELDTALMNLEGESRRAQTSQLKVQHYEEKEEREKNEMCQMKTLFESKCEEAAALKEELSKYELELREASEVVEVLKKKVEVKSSELEDLQSRCGRLEKNTSLQEATLFQLEDEREKMKERLADNEEKLVSLEKEVQVKTMAAEKLLHDLEEEKLGHFEYKKQVEGAIEEILNS